MDNYTGNVFITGKDGSEFQFDTNKFSISMSGIGWDSDKHVGGWVTTSDTTDHLHFYKQMPVVLPTAPIVSNIPTAPIVPNIPAVPIVPNIPAVPIVSNIPGLLPGLCFVCGTENVEIIGVCQLCIAAIKFARKAMGEHMLKEIKALED